MQAVTRTSGEPSTHRSGQRRRQVLGAGSLLLAAAVIAVLYLRPDPFASNYQVRALFPNAIGIADVGRDVRIAGVNVGTISNIARAGDHALITMSLQSRYQNVIHTNATAELRPRFAFEGTAFITIYPGTAGAPLLGSATLPLSQTSTYVSLDEATRFATAPVRGSAAALAADASALLSGPGDQQAIQHVLRSAPSLERHIAVGARAAMGPTGTELSGLVRGAEQTIHAVATQNTNLEPLLAGAQRTFAAFETQGGTALGATVQRLGATLSSLQTGGASLITILGHLDPVARDLEPGLAALAPTIDVTEPLLRRAAPTLSESVPLVSSLRSALAAGAAASPPAGVLLRSLDQSDALLNSSLLPALYADTPLHVPAYLTLLNLFEGGAGAFGPFQTNASGPPPGHMGNGHFVRFDGHFYSGVGIPAPPCTLLDTVDASLASQLATVGLCVR
jgi:ABC-type transporter Mla subunit MlaD